ncbi:MAG: FAD-dependent oxidoreductase, partial [Clostridia bacterium]|nr:FAD-dependent oxidoreductase [Clostridia bacterium]
MRILQEKLKMEVTSLKHAKEIENNGEYDFLIIGSGSAAFASAIKAKEYGAKVGMIESGTVGGTCVNFGCVPSKTLLKAGEINSLAKENPYYGLRTSAQKADLPLLVSQKDALVNELRQKKYIDLIDEYGIELIQGEATFINENTLEVNGKQISANRFLIATGASP